MQLKTFLSEAKTTDAEFGARLAKYEGVGERSAECVRKWKYAQRAPGTLEIDAIAIETGGAVTFADWAELAHERWQRREAASEDAA